MNEIFKFKTEEEGAYKTIFTDHLYVKLNKETGAIIFLDSNKRPILKAAGKDASTFTRAVVGGESIFHVKQLFYITEDEGLYGLGQFENPMMNYRGKDILLAQANRTAVNPFLVSTKGYGILWDNPSESRFHDGADGMYLWSEVADQIDYYFVYGPTIDEVIAGYRKITGGAPMFGKWASSSCASAFGYPACASVTEDESVLVSSTAMIWFFFTLSL
jgi:alpha-D-xyloside xylohydrolase